MLLVTVARINAFSKQVVMPMAPDIRSSPRNNINYEIIEAQYETGYLQLFLVYSIQIFMTHASVYRWLQVEPKSANSRASE